MTGSRTGCPQR